MPVMGCGCALSKPQMWLSEKRGRVAGAAADNVLCLVGSLLLTSDPGVGSCQ